jgi:2-polyprenyl-3-methyl-5-hydroxy-6-metoxy-1,4-benzoquinol methylase
MPKGGNMSRKFEKIYTPKQEYQKFLKRYANSNSEKEISNVEFLKFASFLFKRQLIEEAQEVYELCIKNYPNYIPAYEGLSAAQLRLGEHSKSLKTLEHIEAIDPTYKNLKKQIAIRHKILGNHREHYNYLQKAIQLGDQTPDTLNSYGLVAYKLANHMEAIKALVYASERSNFNQIYLANLAFALKGIRISQHSPRLITLLEKILSSKNITRPKNLSPLIVSQLTLDNDFMSNIGELENENLTACKLNSALNNIARNNLFTQFIKVSPMPNLMLEAYLRRIRSIFLNHSEIEYSEDVIHLLYSLYKHCQVNEFIYSDYEEEQENLTILLNREIKEEKHQLIRYLILGCFRDLSLEQLKKAAKLRSPVTKYLKSEADFLRRYQSYKQKFEFNLSFANDTTAKVSTQYNKFPYPRYENLQIALQKYDYKEWLVRTGLDVNQVKSVQTKVRPTILVAGCGTGQQSIELASSLSNADFTAIDVSPSSLAYAKAKSDSQNLSNIQYLACDILELESLGKNFDYIECTGVLHHMDQPEVGLLELAKSLHKTNGIMKIALYSRLARRNLSSNTNGSSSAKDANEIKKLREKLITDGHFNKSHTNAIDFYYLSGFKDLMLHEHEVLFSIPEIEKMLTKLNLEFLGFQNSHTNFIQKFSKLNPNPSDMLNLEKWHEFEVRNPDTFWGMYTFWCKHKISN